MEFISRLMAASAAMQGGYSREKVRKLSAVSGVKMLCSAVPGTSPSPPISTDRVLMTTSLAVRPVTSAVARAPVSEAQRCEEGGDKTADAGQHTVFGIFDHIEAGIEALQQPNDDAGHKDNGKGFVEEVFSLAPHMQHDVAGGGQSVGGQLHHEGYGLAVIDEGF